MRILILLSLMALFLSGCQSVKKHSANPAHKAHLVFSFTDVEDSSLVSKLRCTRMHPASCQGALECPSKAQKDACEYLFAHKAKLFKELDPGQACTEIYGGPEKGSIQGQVDGKAVQVELSRTNGCEIARFDLHRPLFS